MSFGTATHGIHLDITTGEATGDGRDHIVGEPGQVTFAMSGHDDVVKGSSADDTIFLRGGSDVVRAGAGDDLVYGSDRRTHGDRDRIFGGAGDDKLDTASAEPCSPEVLVRISCSEITQVTRS